MKINKYKGLKAVRVVQLVTDEQLAQQLEEIRRQYPLSESITDRAAKLGDEVLIDYAGFVGETQFEGGTAERQPLMLGSGTFIPGFEEQLVGAKVGDKVDVKVTFPQEYHATDLAGKEAVFHCTVHAITAKSLRALDDQFAKDIGMMNTMEEMKAALRAQMQQYADQVSDAQMRDQLLNALVAECEGLEVSDELIEAELDDAIKTVYQQLQQQGLTLNDYLQFCGRTMEDLRDELRPNATSTVKARLALQEVSRLENITVSEEEIEAEYQVFSRECGIPVEQLKQACGNDALEALRKDVTMKKTIAILVDNAEITVQQA
ncbi:MAG: trigger factor [Clostridia bacterium]|nr:trigger factor [Clostridia bacterium]